MAFRISGNLGDRKPYLRFSPAPSAASHVEVTIDDTKIDREQTSRMLRLMAERLLECNWPPNQVCLRVPAGPSARRQRRLAPAS